MIKTEVNFCFDRQVMTQKTQTNEPDCSFYHNC